MPIPLKHHASLLVFFVQEKQPTIRKERLPGHTYRVSQKDFVAIFIYIVLFASGVSLASSAVAAAISPRSILESNLSRHKKHTRLHRWHNRFSSSMSSHPSPTFLHLYDKTQQHTPWLSLLRRIERSPTSGLRARKPLGAGTPSRSKYPSRSASTPCHPAASWPCSASAAGLPRAGIPSQAPTGGRWGG